MGTYIDPIVAKADPSLFQNSSYVQAVNRSSTKLWFLFDLYVELYKIIDFEKFIIFLEILSLFSMMAGIFVLANVLFRSSAAGYLGMLLYTAKMQDWLLGFPGPYLNFFHHGLPIAYPLILFSLIFFLKKRFSISLLLAGIAFNFHVMSISFLLFAYFFYWLFNLREFKPVQILLCCISFSLPALPTLVNMFTYMGNIPPPDANWMEVVRMIAGYQCFPSLWPLLLFAQAFFFFALFAVSLMQVPNKRPVVIFSGAVAIMCIIGTVFVDWYPIPLVIKLSFWRSTLIYLFFALPCIAYVLVKCFNHSATQRFIAIALGLIITGYFDSLKLYYLPFFTLWLVVELYKHHFQDKFPLFVKVVSAVFYPVLVLLIAQQCMFGQGGLVLFLLLSYVWLFSYGRSLLTKFLPPRTFIQKKWVQIVCFCILIDILLLYNAGGPQIYFHGGLFGKPDPWADVQIAARRYSHKDDLFIIPPYLSSFGIYSYRATLGDWAEVGNVLYSDNKFARECLPRMKDLGWKEITDDGNRGGYNSLTTDQIRAVAIKYGAKFVVTVKPKTFSLPVIYENKRYLLYKIL